MKQIFLTSIVLSLCYLSSAGANEPASTAAPSKTAYIISPTDGKTVPKVFKVQFGLSGVGVAPAGIKKENTGHHHLLIDSNIQSIDLTKPLLATDKLKHFGGGQTETTLSLTPGKHTLQLLLGNYAHIPHAKPVVSEKITITVE